MSGPRATVLSQELLEERLQEARRTYKLNVGWVCRNGCLAACAHLEGVCGWMWCAASCLEHCRMLAQCSDSMLLLSCMGDTAKWILFHVRIQPACRQHASARVPSPSVLVPADLA